MEKIFENKTTKILIDEECIIIYHEDKALKVFTKDLMCILGELIANNNNKEIPPTPTRNINIY